eukprot:gene21804-22881_t
MPIARDLPSHPSPSHAAAAAFMQGDWAAARRLLGARRVRFSGTSRRRKKAPPARYPSDGRRRARPAVPPWPR